jgi:aerobic-type carbon monoxide dehydrogenase small subunit (CoxS/CutS family)
MKEKIQFKVNDRPVELDVDPNRMLLWVLRTDLGLTGTKYGCGQSHCGACTVLVNNGAVRSCQTPVKDVRGQEVLTIQKAFMAQDALQCGFCTPGMIMNAHALLLKNPRPSPTEILEGMDDNLCRCGSHTRIVRAIQAVAEGKERRA